MADFAESIVVALVIIGPFIGYHAMVRRADRTRGQLILAAALGALGPAILVGAASALITGVPTVELLPWIAVALLYGCLVGLLGVAARMIGAWLSRRQT